jgi:hypothetical protein
MKSVPPPPKKVTAHTAEIGEDTQDAAGYVGAIVLSADSDRDGA